MVYMAGLKTASYALSISIAQTYTGCLFAVRDSMAATMVAIAVAVLRPGQNPCWSLEYRVGTKGPIRFTNNLESTLYQIDVTEIGLRLAGLSVGLSGFGIAVIKVVSSFVSVSPFANCHKNLHISVANSSFSASSLSSGTSIPNAPTAVLVFIPKSTSRSSSIVNSASRVLTSAGAKGVKYDRYCASTGGGEQGRLRKELKWSRTCSYEASTGLVMFVFANIPKNFLL